MVERAHAGQRAHIGLEPIGFLALGADEYVVGNLPLGGQVAPPDRHCGAQALPGRSQRLAIQRVGKQLAQQLRIDVFAANQRVQRIELVFSPGIVVEQRQQVRLVHLLGQRHDRGDARRGSEAGR